MAIVGQQLTAPESGWRRYDDTDSRIIYTGNNWASSTTLTTQGVYNSSDHWTPPGTGNTSLHFKFYGTKIRILATYGSVYNGNAYSTDNSITIDGTTETYTQYNASIATTTQIRQVLVYESTGLDLGTHEIVMNSGPSSASTNTYGLEFDAIDIDSDGYLLHPTLTQRTKLEDMETGDCIPCRYTATTSGVAGFFSELGTCIANEIPVTGTATPNGLFYFYKLSTGKLGADRVIQTNISWDALNSAKYIEGAPYQYFIQPKPNWVCTADAPAYTGSSIAGPIGGGGWTKAGYAPAWWQVDFPEPLAIKSIYFTVGGAPYYQDFDVYISKDTGNGNFVFTKFNAGGSYRSSAAQRVQCDINAPIRSFKIQYTGGTSWVHVSNVQFTENPTTDINTRSFSGGNSYLGSDGLPKLTNQRLGTWPPNNEWDTYVTNSTLGGKITPKDDTIWHISKLYSHCMDTPINGNWSNGSTTGTATNTKRMERGYTTRSVWDDVNWAESSTVSADYGFRPILEYKHNKQTNLWY